VFTYLDSRIPGGSQQHGHLIGDGGLPVVGRAVSARDAALNLMMAGIHFTEGIQDEQTFRLPALAAGGFDSDEESSSVATRESLGKIPRAEPTLPIET
jgi:hypothetical protein